MALNKNDEIEINIDTVSLAGSGVGRCDGMAVFVPASAVGDRLKVHIIKAKKTYAVGRIVQILSPSEDRETDSCRAFPSCGGCAFRHMSYSSELKLKHDAVRDAFKRIGGIDIEPRDIIGAQSCERYRNKAQFPIGRDREGKLIAGFYAGRTHSIIPVEDCVLGVPVNREILACVLGYMEEFHVSPYDEKAHQGLVRHVLIRYGFRTGEIMVCLVVNGTSLPEEEALATRLAAIPKMTSITLNVNQEKTNVIMGKKLRVLWGKGYITDEIGDVKYQISPLSFYQVNPVQTEKLYGTALEYAGLKKGEDTVVWDLYCGIGTISLFLARKAGQVYGVEIVPQAVEDARNNARINGITNARFYVGKAEEVLPEYYADYEKKHGERARADVIVVDPPRKGCDEALLETIVKMEPEKVVYVSCDPATLARDVKYLRENGYEVRRVRAVDMFPHTVHVETVCLMSRSKGK